MFLSIVIPTLDEEAALPQTLESVARAVSESNLVCEIIIADGGSKDGTRNVATSHFGETLRWVDAERGRGAQMNAGARAAAGEVLLFLHADTRLAAGAPDLIRQALARPRVVGGNFRIRFEPRSPLADFYTACYNLRSLVKVFYGDSAIFVRRDVFERIGGYRHARIMEDLELVRRLRRVGRLVTIRENEVVSSSRRFHNAASGIRALALWTWLHILFYCGASQEALERRYPRVR